MQENFVNNRPWIGKKEGEQMEMVVKAVVIGVLTVVIAALEQKDGDE